MYTLPEPPASWPKLVDLERNWGAISRAQGAVWPAPTLATHPCMCLLL